MRFKGEQLTLVMEQRGWSKSELARQMADVGDRTANNARVGRWAAGQNEPRGSNLVALELATGIPAREWYEIPPPRRTF